MLRIEQPMRIVKCAKYHNRIMFYKPNAETLKYSVSFESTTNDCAVRFEFESSIVRLIYLLNKRLIIRFSRKWRNAKNFTGKLVNYGEDNNKFGNSMRTPCECCLLKRKTKLYLYGAVSRRTYTLPIDCIQTCVCMCVYIQFEKACMVQFKSSICIKVEVANSQHTHTHTTRKRKSVCVYSLI